jgi:hypothetical protein
MIDVDKVREEIQGVINEFGMDYYKGNYFELTSQALNELKKLQQFKKKFDAYELSKKRGFIAYENWKECEKEVEYWKKMYKEVEYWKKMYFDRIMEDMINNAKHR